MVGFQLGAVAATAGSFVSRLCRLLVGFPPAATRSTDALGRPSGFALDDDYAVSYAYDMYGSFHSVASAASATSAVTFTYSYLPNTDLISGMTASSGFLWTRAYESGRSLITTVENRFGETVISRYDYENDALGRRTARADSGLAFAAQPTYGNSATVEMPAYNAYSYNTRSEVTGAQRYHGTDVSDTSTVYGGRQFGYEYDPIGNRISASATIGGVTLTKGYTANVLNQYTAIANPGAVGLRGDATNSAVVTVNGEAVQSDGITSDTIPWHFALEADNGSGPDFPLAEIVAVGNPPGTNTPDIVSTASGHLYAPPQNETLTYDLDGNLLSDGRWQYTWNGENRLIKAEELVSPTNRQPYMVDYAYVHQGRMVWKQFSTNAVVLSSRTFLWDGYNIIRETINHQPPTTNYYVWGLDLSGTLQGAGGVGGLLAEVRDGVPYLATFDANGNVTEYVSTDGTLAAHYEYSTFGEIVVQSGDQADSFTHRFSTKPWCPVTGLSEYLFRKYSPSLGRWLSRDPIEEEDSTLAEIVNSFNSNKETETLYLALLNDSINHYDLLGLTTPCSRFKRENPEKVGTDLGGIICNNGTMHFCVWTDPSTNPGIDYCIGQHEIEHKDNTQPCKPCGFERQSFKPMTFDEVRQEECKAHKKELDCLNKEVNYRCNKLIGPEKVKCLEEFIKIIDELRCVNIPAYCGTPVPEGCQ